MTDERPCNWCYTCSNWLKRGICAPCVCLVALSDAPEIEKPVAYEEVQDENK